MGNRRWQPGKRRLAGITEVPLRHRIGNFLSDMGESPHDVAVSGHEASVRTKARFCSCSRSK